MHGETDESEHVQKSVNAARKCSEASASSLFFDFDALDEFELADVGKGEEHHSCVDVLCTDRTSMATTACASFDEPGNNDVASNAQSFREDETEEEEDPKVREGAESQLELFVQDMRYSRDWDQVVHNEDQCGVITTFDEECYTTKVDPDSISAEMKEKADRLMREIEADQMSADLESKIVGEEMQNTIKDVSDEIQEIDTCLEERYKLYLKPFLANAWTSKELGVQNISGDIGSGELQASCDGASRIIRLEDVDSSYSLRLYSSMQSVWEKSEDALRLMPGKSKRNKVVWGSPDGKPQETWNRQEISAGSCGGSMSSDAQAESEKVSVSRWRTDRTELNERLRKAHEAQCQEQLRQGLEALNAQRFEEASQLLLDARRGSQSCLEAMCNRTIALVALGHYKDAMNEAKCVLEMDSDSYAAHRNLGLVRAACGNYEGADVAYRMAWNLLGDKSHPDANAILQGLHNAQRKLLPPKCPSPASAFVPGRCATIYDATHLNCSLEQVWKRSCGSRRTNPTAPRQFSMCHETKAWQGGRMPYIVSLPAAHLDGQGTGKTYPLLVYLHSAGGANICKGDAKHLMSRQIEFVGQEAPHIILIDQGKEGLVDEFIGVAPSCPANVGGYNEGAMKKEKKRKVYWFKTSETNDYNNWDFAGTERCREVEFLTMEVLAEVCTQLPVDPSRIYFFGASAGGYAVLRLAELLCELPAAIVPMAGYYPDLPNQDHSVENLARCLRSIRVRPLHCKNDKLCKIDQVHVSKAYDELSANGVEVQWVDDAVAAGHQKNFHSPHVVIFQDPDGFFRELLRWRRDSSEAFEDPAKYLRKCAAASNPMLCSSS